MRRQLREAAWMARCVGRCQLSPFTEAGMAELGRMLVVLVSATVTWGSGIVPTGFRSRSVAGIANTQRPWVASVGCVPVRWWIGGSATTTARTTVTRPGSAPTS